MKPTNLAPSVAVTLAALTTCAILFLKTDFLNGASPSQAAELSPEYAKSTLVKAGEAAPDFSSRTIAGEEFSLSKEKGKVVLINFFATWCGPCMEEMPRLEKDVFLKFGSRKDFRLIAIGREHNAEELAKFKKEKKFSLPIAPDPHREIYGKYALQYIPRNVLIGKDGKVKLVSVGYSEKDFEELMQAIKSQLESQ